MVAQGLPTPQVTDPVGIIPIDNSYRIPVEYSNGFTGLPTPQVTDPVRIIIIYNSYRIPIQYSCGCPGVGTPQATDPLGMIHIELIPIEFLLSIPMVARVCKPSKALPTPQVTDTVHCIPTEFI